MIKDFVLTLIEVKVLRRVLVILIDEMIRMMRIEVSMKFRIEVVLCLAVKILIFVELNRKFERRLLRRVLSIMRMVLRVFFGSRGVLLILRVV